MSDLRILLVDDSESDILLYKRYLSKGFLHEKITFLEATSGEEALKRYASFKPHGIVLDYNLPDMNGHALFKRMKSLDDQNNPGVIVITASGNENVAVRLMKEGAHDYLNKDDLTQDKLCNSLNSSIEKSELEKKLKEKTEELSAANESLLHTIESLKNKEALIAANESKLRLMLNTIPHIVFRFVDSFENTTFLNKKSYEYMGVDREKIFNVGNYIHPDDIARAAAHWKQSIQEGKEFSYELRFRNADEEYRWMETSIVPIKNENGEITEWIGACTDIHEKKLRIEDLNRSQEELQDLNTNLSRVNSDLDSFVYAASHDLKAPINNLELLITTLVEDFGDKDPATAKLLNLTTVSIERLKKTVDNLSEILSVEDEKNHNVEQISFQEVFDNISYDLQKQIDESNAIIKMDFSKAPTISLSPKNLRSVVYNIFSNAIKYRDYKRPLEIAVYTKMTEGNYLLLSIKDNGLGLKDSDREKVFSLFKRIHNHVDGSGVGPLHARNGSCPRRGVGSRLITRKKNNRYQWWKNRIVKRTRQRVGV